MTVGYPGYQNEDQPNSKMAGLNRICEKNENQLNETQQPTMRKKGSPWVCDHDHTKKTFRGWICRKCNLGLGNFNDDYTLVLNAAKYLKEYSA